MNIRKYLNLEWSYPDNDCYAFVNRVARDNFGFELPSISLPTQSSLRFNLEQFEQHKTSFLWEKKERASSGCVALIYFKVREKLRPYHIGICVDNRHILHCAGNAKHPGVSELVAISNKPKFWAEIEFYSKCK